MNTGINAPVQNLIVTTRALDKGADLTVKSFRYATDSTDAEVIVLTGPGAPAMLGMMNVVFSALSAKPEPAVAIIDQLRELVSLQPPHAPAQPAEDGG